VPSTLFEMIPKILSDYRSVYPEVTVSVHSMDTTPLIERLIGGDLDAGFLRCDPHATGLAARRLHAERHVVALPKIHPLAGAERVALADLADEQFVVFPRGAAQNFDLLTTATTNADSVPTSSSSKADSTPRWAMSRAESVWPSCPNHCRELCTFPAWSIGN
jgi:DNA-binding transcriptional LysR family regulator